MKLYASKNCVPISLLKYLQCIPVTFIKIYKPSLDQTLRKVLCNLSNFRKTLLLTLVNTIRETERKKKYSLRKCSRFLSIALKVIRKHLLCGWPGKSIFLAVSKSKKLYFVFLSFESRVNCPELQKIGLLGNTRCAGNMHRHRGWNSYLDF